MLETSISSPDGRLRAAIYARSAIDPGSIDVQVRACQATNFGWNVRADHVIADRAVSGRTLAGRPGWQELMRLASATPRPFDVIITADISRLGRSLTRVFRQIDELDELGVFIYFANQGLDSREPHFATLRSLLGFTDEQFEAGRRVMAHRGHENIPNYRATSQM